MRSRATIVIGLGRRGGQVVSHLRSRLQGRGAVEVLSVDTREDSDVPVEPAAARGRAAGRAAFFQHFERLRERLKASHARVRDPRLASFDPRQPTDVYVVSCAGESLGSGMLLDLSFWLKHDFRQHGVNVQGFLLFPESPEDSLGWAQAYALLKEVNHYSYGDYLFEVEWSAGQPQRVSLPPFDQCYLFHYHPQALASVAQVVAGAILSDLQDGEFSELKRSVRVNLKQYCSRTFDVDHGDFAQRFVCRYASLGQSEWQVPFAALRRLCSLRLAREVIGSWLEAQESGPPLEGLLADLGLGLEPLRKGEGLIRALVFGDGFQEELGKLRVWARSFIQALESTPASGADPLADLENSTLDREGQLVSPAVLKYRAGRALVESVSAVERHIAAQIRHRGVRAGQDLGPLTQALRQAIAILPEHTAGWAGQHRQQVHEALSLLAELRQVQSWPNWDARKGPQRRHLLSLYFQATIEFGAQPGSLACWAWENAGYEALDVCRKLLAHVQESLKPRLEQLLASLDGAEAEFSRDYAAELEKLRALPLGLDGEVLQEQIYTAFVPSEARRRETGERLLARRGRGLAEGAVEPLAAPLLKEAGRVFARIDVEFSPPHLLMHQEELVRRLVAESQPWIEGRRQNHLFQLHAYQTQCLVGLPELRPDATPLERESFHAALAQLRQRIVSALSGPVSFATLSGGDRIVVYQEVAGFPLHFLDGLQGARDHYRQFLQGGEPLHVHQGVDPAEDFQIYTHAEVQALRRAMRCYVLGCLFNLIECDQDDYHWPGEGACGRDRDSAVLFLSHVEPLRQSLGREVEERLEAICSGAELEGVAVLGGLVALQKRAVYGPLWGRVSGPAELPPMDRLEVAVLSELERELHESPTVQRHGEAALHRVVDGLREAATGWVRPDSRYSLGSSQTEVVR